MSGPYRFTGEDARSPLDRSSSPFSAGQPVSFKTNVNRAKTKKWVQAKKNAYDGDDWGDYDEYDEYGANQEPAPAQQEPQRYYAQQQPSRSFTDPSQQAPLPRARRNSFEHGEEQRAFSSSVPHPQQGHGQHYGAAQGQGSGVNQSGNYDASQSRDFTSPAAPPPLQTRISQTPTDVVGSPSNMQFPPRKSSVGQAQSPIIASPRSPGSDKPLPFIRPADIYKRYEEERVRERASLESSRPSLDSLASRPKDDLTSPPLDNNRVLAPLATVAERKSEYLPEFDASRIQQNSQPAQGPSSVVSPPDEQGFRSVVDQAFVRTDDSRSVPPTPISKDSSSDISRTNTGSTSGISPIMSRVPSSATSALRSRDQTGVEGSTPAIAEEPNEISTPVPPPTSTFAAGTSPYLPQQSTTGHSRNISASSLPRSGLATPTRGDSPARSPVISPKRNLTEPEAALLETETAQEAGVMEGGLKGPSAAYASRESDIATAMQHGPARTTAELGAVEKLSQDTFLESHNAQSPIQDALPRDRSESPSKGRVQALAGRFGDVSNSRRGSTQSNMSRNSVQSWEKSQDNSRAPSPTKGSPSKPSSPVKEFRPHLPGQWESYATTAATPAEQADRQLGIGEKTSTGRLEDADLTPTTARTSVADTKLSDTTSPTLTEDPIAALKDAGAAMVNSIRQTVGIEDSAESSVRQRGRPSHGDVYLPRPLQLDRTASSISSMPPTPPAKDTPQSEFPPLVSTTSEATLEQQRPSPDPQLSSDTYGDDEESDRLRKEIVASLSPIKASPNPVGDNKRVSFAPGSTDINRASSILPSEYDTYWADEDNASSEPPRQVENAASIAPTTATTLAPSQGDTQPKSVMLNRFSWEASTPQIPAPTTLALADTPAEPVKGLQVQHPSAPADERRSDESTEPWAVGTQDTYFGPGHTLTVTKPEPVTEEDLGARSPITLSATTQALVSPSLDPPRPSSPGLHVVNTRDNPEAVDLPPRFSAEHEQVPEKIQKDVSLPQAHFEPLSAQVSPIEASKPVPASQEPEAKSPTTDKPLGAREIATITSTSERIATYNQTREHWATHDHGLEDWLSSTLQANPELATQSFPAQRVPTASARHRHTGSLALLGKLGGASHHDLSSESQSNAGVQSSGSPSSPTHSRPSALGAFSGRVPSQQLKTQGKDLLHTANVLGGKGMTSAKGLFAKGKSRFGRDSKSLSHSRSDSTPPLRAVSAGPETIARFSRASTSVGNTPERSTTTLPTETDTLPDERKRRRFSFSSAFRRTSRSRSRPNSIALPGSTSSVFGSTPRGTPSREFSRILDADNSRPHSYHTSDSWNFAPGVASPEQLTSTPPRQEQRLGILPSPARSAFSSQERDAGEDVPPVPAIPNDVAARHHRRMSQESASHKMLQSIVRYATPPVPNVDSRHLAQSPVIAGDDTVAAAQDQVLDDSNVHPREREYQAALTSKSAVKVSVHPLLRDNFDDSEDSASVEVRHNPPSYVQTEASDSRRSTSAQNENDTYDNAISRDSTVLRHETHAPRSEDSSDAQIASVGDTAFLLAHQPRDDEDTSETSDEAMKQELSRSFVDNTTNEYTGTEDNATREHVVPEPKSSLHLENLAKLREAQRRLAYETELVGAGDVSPITTASFPFKNDGAAERSDTEDTVWFAKSELQLPKTRRSQASQEAPGDETSDANWPLTDERTDARSTGEIAQPVLGPQATRDDSSPDHVRLDPNRPQHFSAQPDRDNQPSKTRRVSAMPLQVAYAIQEADTSSLASWDRDSIASKPHSRSQSGVSQMSMIRDENDLVTPIPRISQDMLSTTDKAEKLRQPGNVDNEHVTNQYMAGSANASGSVQVSQQPQDPNSLMTGPERSRSMLSQISAMVSEGGTPISPSGSNAGRSTPSTIRRMDRDHSARQSTTPAQIPEEVMTGHWDDRTPTAQDDGFDLYADHNGIVKDLHDERERPVQFADAQSTARAQDSTPTRVSEPTIDSVPPSRGSERPRYSTERPMSFISGPPDEHGNPQDQINQFGSPDHPLSNSNLTQNGFHPQQSSIAPGGMVYSAPVNQVIGQHPVRQQHEATASPQRPAQPAPMDRPAQYSSQSLESSQAQPTPSVTASARTPGHPEYQYSRPAEYGQVLSNNQASNNAGAYAQDLRNTQDHHTPQFGLPVAQNHDMRGQLQPAGLGHQYERQQMMHSQAQHGDSPQHATGNAPPRVFSQQLPNHQDKQPTKMGFSSVLKGLGSKPQQSSQDSRIVPNGPHIPINTNRNASLHSAVSGLSTTAGRPDDHNVAAHAGPASIAAGPNHQHGGQQNPNIGSNLNSVDPRMMTPNQHDPRQQYLPPVRPSAGYAQGSYAPAASQPEPGKKKRFSALGALFGRSGKEDKKIQKASRHSTPPATKAAGPQWAPQQQQQMPQQSGLAYHPPGQLPPHTVAGTQALVSQIAPKVPAPQPGTQHMPAQRVPQPQQHMRQMPAPQHMRPGNPSESESAYLRTKQLAEEHQRRMGGQPTATTQQNLGPSSHSGTPFPQQNLPQQHQTDPNAPMGGYYRPETKQDLASPGSHAASVIPRQQSNQQQGHYEPTEAERLGSPQQQRRPQQSPVGQEIGSDPSITQHYRQQPSIRGPPGLMQHPTPPSHQIMNNRQHRQAVTPDGNGVRSQQGPGSLNSQQQSHAQEGFQDNHRSVSNPTAMQPLQINNAQTPRHVSSPLNEPRYDAPPIPAAYRHVSGAFVSPNDLPQQAMYNYTDQVSSPPSMNQYEGHYSDPRMPSISPQVSLQSQFPPPNNRTHSDASAVSVISPVSQSPDIPTTSPPPAQRVQQPRMSSITEAGQVEKPWHLNFPAGATEQEIVRARQRQYMEEQFTHAERAGRAASPRSSPSGSSQVTPTANTSQTAMQNGGFREVQPRNSTQPYQVSQNQQPRMVAANLSLGQQPLQPVPVHPEQIGQPAAIPLPMSPDPVHTRSPIKPAANVPAAPPPPKAPHSTVPPVNLSSHSPSIQGRSAHHEVDEPPPSYDGPGVLNGGINKIHAAKNRPANIVTNADMDDRARDASPRSRQASIGILQHPQPASMAASPQRSSADMGAESLRRQLLQQEEYARMERIQRAQMQQAETERERQQREAARARARELERSASGGGQVGSLRSVGGSRGGGTPGWERRGSSSSRPVFELPAVEDDEPNMKATSYPGQEWVPPMWTDD